MADIDEAELAKEIEICENICVSLAYHYLTEEGASLLCPSHACRA